MIGPFEAGLHQRMTVAIAVPLLLLGFLIACFSYVVQIRAIASSEAQATQEIQRLLPSTTARADSRAIASSILTRFYHSDLAIAVGKGDTFYRGRWNTHGHRYAMVAGTQMTMLVSLYSRDFMERVSRSMAAIAGLELRMARVGNATVVVDAKARVLIELAQRFAATLTAVMILSALLANAASRRLSRRALEPLHLVLRELESLARGEFAPRRVETTRNDELGHLTAAYNAAAQTVIAALSERTRSEDQMRQFTADAAHQLRTPLTVLRGFIGILRKGQVNSPDDVPRILDTLDRQSDVMAALTKRLMEFPGWGHAQNAESVDIAQVVEESVTPLAGANPHRDIRVHICSRAHAFIARDELSYAVTNLVDNALKYAPQGEITVLVDRVGTSVEISVTDRGPGIPEEHLEHIFDRFYRGRQREVSGSGLGLAIAKRAVERARGTLSVESRQAMGSRFTIVLPARSTPAQEVEYSDELCVA